MREENCNDYVPHAIYNFLFYSKDGQTVHVSKLPRIDVRSMESKKGQLNEILRDKGWLYCIDCKEPVYDSSGLSEHLTAGHFLSNEFMPDRVAPEEVPAVS